MTTSKLEVKKSEQLISKTITHNCSLPSYELYQECCFVREIQSVT